jgi:hypothetical protein
MKTYTNQTCRAFLGVVAATAIGASTVFAANVHIPGKAPGKNLTFKDLGTTLETCVKFAGLGNQDALIEIEVTGTVDATVFNPGGNAPPGKQMEELTAVGSVVIAAEDITGTVSVCLTTDELDADDVAAKLPNPKWTVVVDDVEFYNVTIRVTQGGKVVFEEEYTLD